VVARIAVAEAMLDAASLGPFARTDAGTFLRGPAVFFFGASDAISARTAAYCGATAAADDSGLTAARRIGRIRRITAFTP
jgi:hypothetical protein